jgi:hypothetical protein
MDAAAVTFLVSLGQTRISVFFPWEEWATM